MCVRRGIGVRAQVRDRKCRFLMRIERNERCWSVIENGMVSCRNRRMAKSKEKSIGQGNVASWRIDSHGAYGDTKTSGQRIKKQRFDNETGARIQSIDRECTQKSKNQIESRNGRTIDALRTASNADRWVEVDRIQKKKRLWTVCLSA